MGILAIFQSIGLPEIVLVLAVLLLLFGARKLPELAKSLGRSTKEFKSGMRDGAAEDEQEDRQAEASTESPAAEKQARSE
jgi:sec-independent protein translocase protein TatA